MVSKKAATVEATGLNAVLHSQPIMKVAVYFVSEPQGVIPSVVVGVVGIGHVEGITQNWDKQIDVKELLRYSAWTILHPFLFGCSCVFCFLLFFLFFSRRYSPAFVASPRCWQVSRKKIRVRTDDTPWFLIRMVYE